MYGYVFLFSFFLLRKKESSGAITAVILTFHRLFVPYVLLPHVVFSHVHDFIFYFRYFFSVLIFAFLICISEAYSFQSYCKCKCLSVKNVKKIHRINFGADKTWEVITKKIKKKIQVSCGSDLKQRNANSFSAKKREFFLINLWTTERKIKTGRKLFFISCILNFTFSAHFFLSLLQCCPLNKIYSIFTQMYVR